MRISTRLRTTSYISIGVLLAFASTLFWSFGQFRRAMDNNVLAKEIVTTIFERTTLRDEYFDSGAERAFIQWNSCTETLDRLLHTARERFREEPDKALLVEMRNQFAATVDIVARLTRLKKVSGSNNSNEFLKKKLLTQITLSAASLYASASQLQETSRRLVDMTYKRTVTVSAIFVMAVALTTILNSTVVNRALRKRLTAIHSGAEVIAAGNLEHRIACEGDDELVDLAAALNRMTDKVALNSRQLAAANKELEAFSYSVSHDLRAPLRHINGFVELLCKRDTGALDEKCRHYLQVIAESARNMGCLIDDLLDFSRMGRIEMMQTEISLEKLVSEAQQELQSDLADKDIAWEIAPLPQVYGDAVMLRQVLVNLISNAVKYSCGRAPIRIAISCSMSSSPAETVCAVKDNGTGFDMKYRDKLFGLFQRLHNSEEFEGTGLGLANVRRIIHRHGGRTWAEGAVGEGATFYFSLPNKKELH